MLFTVQERDVSSFPVSVNLLPFLGLTSETLLRGKQQPVYKTRKETAVNGIGKQIKSGINEVSTKFLI